MLRTITMTMAGAAMLLAGAAAAQSPEAGSGRDVAERHCGRCHAVGAGASPTPDAPPLRELHRRYPVGGLPQLLQKGMIGPIDTQVEGSIPRHPMMPQIPLGPGEVFDLIAYLQTLEPQTTGKR